MKNSLIFIVISLFLFTQSDAHANSGKTGPATKFLNETGHLEEVTYYLGKWCPGSGESVFLKIRTAVEEFAECISSDKTQTFCQAMRKKGVWCLSGLTYVAEDCLPSESREIAEMAIRSIVSGLDFVCKQNGSNIFELSNKCLYDSGKHGIDVAECMQNPNRFAKQFEVKPPGRIEICDFARMVRACVAIQTNRECKSWPAKQTIHGLYDAFLAPCNQKVEA